jgi:adenylate cyclase
MIISIRKAAHRVRITGQLVDASTGHHVWADRFEGPLDDVFDLQDRLTESVVGAILPSVQCAEIARAHAKPTANLDAYDLYLRALERHNTHLQTASDEAIELLKRAVHIDPGYSRAKALLSAVYVWRSTVSWGNREEHETAIALAREAVASAQDDPDTLRFAAHALSHFAHDYDLALATLGKAINLNPNSAQTLAVAGWVNLHNSDPDAALDCFRQAIRVSPRDLEIGLMIWGQGVAHLMA